MGNMFSKNPNTISIGYLNGGKKKTAQGMVPPPAMPTGGDVVGTEQALSNAINVMTAQEQAMHNVVMNLQKVRTGLQQQLNNMKHQTPNATPPLMPKTAPVPMATPADAGKDSASLIENTG